MKRLATSLTTSLTAALTAALTVALTLALALPAEAAAPAPEKVNLDIGTPSTIVVRHALTQRQSRLFRFYDWGAIGLGNDGMIRMRDASVLPNYTLKKTAEKLIDQENPDRMSLVYAIAIAYGGEEAVPVVKELMIERWKHDWHSGWWMEDDHGNWVKKP